MSFSWLSVPLDVFAKMINLDLSDPETCAMFLLGGKGSDLPIYRFVPSLTLPEIGRNLENGRGFIPEIDKIWRIISKIHCNNGEYCRFPERNHRFSIDFAYLGWR